MVPSALLALGIAGFAAPALAIDNGLGRKPPMGWRSWNLYGADVNQTLIMHIMDGMVERKRLVDGRPTSLCDLGYCDVGLDDNWQACGKGTDGFQYHVVSGNQVHPLVNLATFPDMKAMTDHAHKLGLTAGWYHNNCICSESKEPTLAEYQGDVQALFDFGFDAVKLDGCGTQRDLDVWSQLLNSTGKPIMIENCHWGQTVPNATWCPWNFFRTSGDVRASYDSIVGNLQTTIHWAETKLSGPGCWAYPDMLQVGVAHGAGGKDDPGLTSAETRAHFGSWCIVSSPLTISYDINNDTVADAMWLIVANPEAIAINQAWAGHSGSPFKQAMTNASFMQANGTLASAGFPSWQYFYKPLGESKTAVLLMNHDTSAQTLTLNFKDVPQLDCSDCRVRDVWARKDLGIFSNTFSQHVDSHDAAFLVLSEHRAAVKV